ncbi:MAG: NUDIX hydrolase N-terminal domain-containing protein [Pseudoleptotrichia goodfellowii]|nr:NUDIX hydrolase N-terminal domain-containing protein [Pseudoleptotrichia goodfellowii]
MEDREQWLKWAMELQSLAQAGLNYAKDVFDVERYTRIREISAEILAKKGDVSLEKVNMMFCNEVGYQTPKMDTRAAVFKNDKILMIKERDKKWALPGGWVDVYLSIKENTEKEVKEEAGVKVTAKKIIAVQDGFKNNFGCGLGQVPYGISKIFVLCSLDEENEGEFVKNIETSERKYFSLDELPELSEIRNTEKQIKMCFKAYKSDTWEAVFD